MRLREGRQQDKSGMASKLTVIHSRDGVSDPAGSATQIREAV